MHGVANARPPMLALLVLAATLAVPTVPACADEKTADSIKARLQGLTEKGAITEVQHRHIEYLFFKGHLSELDAWLSAEKTAGQISGDTHIHLNALLGLDAPDATSPALIARMKDDLPRDPPIVCVKPVVLGVAGAPYVNGLPVIRQTLEIVGEDAKLLVETTPYCREVTPASLPFAWNVTGPGVAVPLDDAGTLRPHFRPVVAGAYQAQLTFCPNHCLNRRVGSGTDVVDIPPISASVTIIVVDRMPVPPGTQPLLPPNVADCPEAEVRPDNVSHDDGDRQCGSGFLAEVFTAQLVTVRPFTGPGDYRLVEGQVKRANIAWNDSALNHESHDVNMHVMPDPKYTGLVVPGLQTITVEWASDSMPGPKRPSAGDRISAYGFHTYDCHHSPIETEIHPAVFTAVHRMRAVQIPDGWAPPGGSRLGSNIWVPGVITDIWANADAGEMSGNCRTTGLHQRTDLGPFFKRCIQSPHPLRRRFSFNIYLPENPQTRVKRAGLVAPAAPLHFRVEPGPGPLPSIERKHCFGVTYLRVTVDLSGYTGRKYSRRIVAAWVQPSAENWGLEEWKVGIKKISVFDAHDSVTDGDWVLWASINNADTEWTQLLDEDSVEEGDYDFDDTPWETQSRHGRHWLGPHLLIFSPRFGQHFLGSPLLDLTRSLELHLSGYEAEFWDDEIGTVNRLVHLRPEALGVGERSPDQTAYSSTSDYKLTYFYERLGPKGNANLTAAGRDLANAYVLGEADCVPRGTHCLVMPNNDTTSAWSPAQEPAPPAGPDFDWSAHPIFARQEPEPGSLTDMPLDVLHKRVISARQHNPESVRRLFAELREELDAVRGTPMESEYARALPPLEENLPADLWQRHFGDIDATPVDLAVTHISMSPAGARAGEPVVFGAEIANRGTGVSAPWIAGLQIDSQPPAVVAIPALAPGTSTAITFPAWTATGGAHSVRATADVQKQIAEPDELDNDLERRIVVTKQTRGLPDLVPVTLRVAACRPREGRPVSFVARVHNGGGNVLPAFVVRFEVDGASLGEVAMPGLAAGKTVKVRSPRWAAVARRHTVTVFVDTRAEVAENDETNNTRARDFEVRRQR